MSDVFLLDPDRAPAVEQPGLAQVIDLLQHVATKREAERRDMLASTFITLSLHELMILVTEVTRATVNQYAAGLWIRTPEEVAALKERIHQLQAAEPDGGTV